MARWNGDLMDGVLTRTTRTPLRLSSAPGESAGYSVDGVGLGVR